ncbi:MAG: efflux RND transporter periplasmic adaptor subunit [Bacteroidia bacterium]|nr:efflux RND transporter periplasmic adaptor subunit [Bacteroidia bacterium]
MKKFYHIFIFILTVSLFVSCSSENEKKQYETISINQKTIKNTVVATGVIKPRVGAEVRVGSRASGIVKKLFVNVGDRVKKGDMLAKLDDTELTAQYNQVLANLENAKTNLKYTKQEKERQETLLAKGFTSQQNYDIAVKNYEMAQAQFAQNNASLDYSKIQLDYTNIIAPVSGVVASVSTQEGETVTAMFSAPTFVTIIDTSRLEVRAYVDETDIGKVFTGQKAGFTVDTYSDIIFEGKVVSIYPKAEILDNVVNYDVIIEITDKKGKTLRPEMTTTVNILMDSLNNVIAIPEKAITKENGESFVYILEGEKPVKRKIITGTKNKSLIQVVSGLKINDKLILNK